MSSWSRSRIVFLYVASLFPGLSSLAESIGIYVRDLWLASQGGSQIYTWAVMPARPKIQHMVEYSALTMMFGLVLVAAFIFLRRVSREVMLTRPERLMLWGYSLLCLVLPVFMPSAGVGAMWLLLVGALPVLMAMRHWAATQRFVAKRVPASLFVCGVALGALLVFLYATAWNPGLRFRNDFAGLPEYTLMADGSWVENNRFLQENRVPGRAELDPCKGDISGGLCVHMPRSIFRSSREAFGLFPSGGGLHYSWDEEKLRAYRAPTNQECLLIEALLQSPQSVCKQLLADSLGQVAPSQYSARVAEFIQKNRSSLGAQEHLGRFFFHHAYLYLPILQALSGMTSDAAALPAQYGRGLTATFAKLLQWTGKHAFQDYFFLYWLGPGLYIALAAIVAFALTRRASLAVAIVALIIGLLPFESIDGLRLAPGFSPWRHMPDLICFLAIGLHAARLSVFSMLLRVASIALLCWWNREFGLFMLAGSTVWHLLTVMQSPARLGKIAACVLAEWGGCGLVMLAIAGISGSNELAFYNLFGVGAPITRWRELVTCAALWLALIGLAAWARFSPAQQRPLPVLDVAGVGFCYAAFATVYALWNPSPGHFSVIRICAALPALCFLQWCFETAERRLFIPERWTCTYVTIALSAIAFTSSVAAAMQTEDDFRAMFQNHRIFDWKLPGIAGRTTADSAPIEQTLGLLQKEQPIGAVVIISRYDVLIHIASGRLTKLPYVDLPSAVISWPVIDAIAAHVQATKPPVIFMDRDIFANREWQLLGEAKGFERSEFYYKAFRTPGVNSFMISKGLMELQPLEFEADNGPRSVSANYHRVGHLAALSMLARKVSECYAPGSSAGLLQAWHRYCKD